LEYGTGCVDNLKWDSEFDGGYLNDTKFEFIKTWLELMPQNKDLYWEAYVLSTYGIWGIETRNREQYYVKNIYNNNIGLYQESLLPDKVENYFCNYYCNRFICGYLSEGTAFWMMFGICLLLIYKRQYTKAVVYAPMAMNFVTLMLAAPVAFAFRYVFTLALAVPFMIITAIWDERVWEEEFFQEEDWQVGGCA
jgi:hypothetical protein